MTQGVPLVSIADGACRAGLPGSLPSTIVLDNVAPSILKYDTFFGASRSQVATSG